MDIWTDFDKYSISEGTGCVSIDKLKVFADFER